MKKTTIKKKQDSLYRQLGRTLLYLLQLPSAGLGDGAALLRFVRCVSTLPKKKKKQPFGKRARPFVFFFLPFSPLLLPPPVPSFRKSDRERAERIGKRRASANVRSHTDPEKTLRRFYEKSRDDVKGCGVWWRTVKQVCGDESERKGGILVVCFVFFFVLDLHSGERILLFNQGKQQNRAKEQRN